MFSWEFSEMFRTAIFFRIPVSILETYIFSPFTSIYHSYSHDFSLVYVYLNAFSLSHLCTWKNMWATISNSQTDRLTACNLKLGRVAAHNSQIARLAAPNSEIIRLATADSQLTTHNSQTRSLQTHNFQASILETLVFLVNSTLETPNKSILMHQK